MLEHHLANVRPEYKVLAARGVPITLDEYKEMRMNSYERKFLLPYFSDEVLFHVMEHARQNSSNPGRAISVTYDESIINDYMPELKARYECLKLCKV
jgi:hypothetical protein